MENLIFCAVLTPFLCNFEVTTNLYRNKIWAYVNYYTGIKYGHKLTLYGRHNNSQKVMKQ